MVLIKNCRATRLAYPLAYATIIFFLSSIYSCQSKYTNIDSNSAKVEAAIREIHTDYVNGWIETDEQKVMSLFEENAMIQPNRLTPIQGKENMRAFWFPDDGSTTTINTFDTEMLNLVVRDTIAITTHSTLLDWDYQQDTTTFGMVQQGINTTVYRQQKDQSWKIWRSMWTDLNQTTK